MNGLMAVLADDQGFAVAPGHPPVTNDSQNSVGCSHFASLTVLGLQRPSGGRYAPQNSNGTLLMALRYKRRQQRVCGSTTGDWVGWAAGEVLRGSPFPSASLQTVRDTFASHRFPVIDADARCRSGRPAWMAS